MMAQTEKRGRQAEHPQDIPKRGWRDILLRVKDEMTADHVSVVSAGVAFFGLLAIFPAIAALISIAGIAFDPATIGEQLNAVAAVLPESAASIMQTQAEKVASNGDTGIGLAALFGIVLSLYSASKGMKTLMEGMNIAYDESEERSFISLNVTALALTLFLIVGMLIALAVTLVAPALLDSLGLSDNVEAAVTFGRWPVLALLTVLGLAVVYRYGPSREDPEWEWVSIGAIAATIVWIAGSIAFSIYVRNFGSYNETYGALGGVIILLTWLWLSAFIVLLGAELNSEMEHQTKKDTTTGAPQPMGERGAAKADTVGEVP
jgi:membrane protein